MHCCQDALSLLWMCVCQLNYNSSIRYIYSILITLLFMAALHQLVVFIKHHWCVRGSQTCDWINTHSPASLHADKSWALIRNGHTCVTLLTHDGTPNTLSKFGWQNEQSSGAPRWWKSVTAKTGVPAGFVCCMLSLSEKIYCMLLCISITLNTQINRYN